MAATAKVEAFIEAEQRVSIATIQLMRYELDRPTDMIMTPHDDYWLDLALTTRMGNARGCFDPASPGRHLSPLGRVFLTPPQQQFRACSDGGFQTSVMCRLSSDNVLRWFDGDFRWTSHRLEGILDIQGPWVRGMLHRLSDELLHPGFASEILIELGVAQLAIEMTRYCASIDDVPAAGGLAAWRLRLIDERLTEMLTPPTLPELAELCNMSVRQLTRGFRASRGRSIGDYIADARFDAAKRLLGFDLGIKAIAYMMGFSSAASFCHAFRSKTGISPGEFRRGLLTPPRPFTDLPVSARGLNS